MISLRIPLELVEKIDDEALERRRSRAFIVLESLEERYKINHKPKKSAAKKKAGAE